MVAPPAPPPPPPAGWSSATMAAAPGSPSAYMGMYPAPSPSYGSYRWFYGGPALVFLPQHADSRCRRGLISTLGPLPKEGRCLEVIVFSGLRIVLSMHSSCSTATDSRCDRVRLSDQCLTARQLARSRRPAPGTCVLVAGAALDNATDSQRQRCRVNEQQHQANPHRESFAGHANTRVFKPSCCACSPSSGPAGSGEYVTMGYQPVTLSRSNSADYGMSLGGGVMAAYSWAPYGASYPMYPGVYSPLFVSRVAARARR